MALRLTTEGRAILDAMLAGRGFATYGQLMTAANVESGPGASKTLRGLVSDLGAALRPWDVPVQEMYGLGFGVPAKHLNAAREALASARRGKHG